MSGVRRRLTELEKEILEVIPRDGTPIELKKIYLALKYRNPRLVKSEESLRKTIEKLVMKGYLRQAGHGKYARPRDLLSYLEMPDILIDELIRKTSSDETIKAGWSLRRELQRLGVPVWKVSEFKSDYIIGGSAGDESSRHIRPYAKLYTGSVIAVTARIRLGGVLPYEAIINQGTPRISFAEPRFIPDHINRGGTVEFLVKRFKEPFLGAFKKLEGFSADLARELARKYDEYSIEEFKMMLISLALNEARYKSTASDFAIALVDGSILPGHLDPHIAPGKDKYEWIEREAPDIARDLLSTKERLLRSYWALYSQARYSENVVLVGAVKSSMDITLQSKTKTYYGCSDQDLLASGLREGEVLGPFKKHRLKEWVIQVKKMEIKELPQEEPPIESYYIKKFPHDVPLQLDIVFPVSFSGEDKRKVISVIYTMIEVSEKHTKLYEKATVVPTLAPIRLIDSEVSKKSEEITNILRREIEGKLAELLMELAKLALRYGADFALYVYDSYVRKLRRVG